MVGTQLVGPTIVFNLIPESKMVIKIPEVARKIHDELISMFSPYDLICFLSPEGIVPAPYYKTPQGKVERLEVDRNIKDVIKESKNPAVTLEGSTAGRVETLFRELHLRISTTYPEGIYWPKK